MSSTNLSDKQGVWGTAKGLDLKLFHKKTGNDRADKGTLGSTMDLCVFLRQKSSNVMICWMDMLVLWGNAGSWSIFILLFGWKGPQELK